MNLEIDYKIVELECDCCYAALTYYEIILKHMARLFGEMEWGIIYMTNFKEKPELILRHIFSLIKVNSTLSMILIYIFE
jgi:hypothetical protein